MNTVYSQEEIIESLKVIKETCEKEKTCFDCPFYANTKDPGRCCMLSEVCPRDWSLVDPDDVVWRAFQ